MTMRSDGWTVREDSLLLSTVVEHVREGKTKALAFQEAGRKIGRTAGACGYRFNSYLSREFKELLDEAKEYRLKVTDHLSLYSSKTKVTGKLIEVRSNVPIIAKLKQNGDKAVLTLLKSVSEEDMLSTELKENEVFLNSTSYVTLYPNN